MYAVGRPGGYLKREARPSEKATLTARKDWTVLCAHPSQMASAMRFRLLQLLLLPDQENAVDTISTWVHQLLWPLVAFHLRPTCVRSYYCNADTGKFLVNPTHEERDHSDLDLELWRFFLFPCLRLAQMIRRGHEFQGRLVRKQLQHFARSRRSLLLSGKRLTVLR